MQMSAAVVVARVLPGWHAVRAPTVTPVMVSGWGAAPDPCFPLLVYFPSVALDSWRASTSFMCLPVLLYTVTKWDFSGIQGWFNIKSLILTEWGGGGGYTIIQGRESIWQNPTFFSKNKNTPQTKNKREFLQLEKGHVCETANIILNGEKLNKYYFLKIRNEMKMSASPLLLNIAL